MFCYVKSLVYSDNDFVIFFSKLFLFGFNDNFVATNVNYLTNKIHK